MERNTLTTVRQLLIGDRFYRATDKKKTVHTMVAGEVKTTHFQTYRFWCHTDTDLRPFAIKGDTQVIFLRNINDEPANSTEMAGSIHAGRASAH